MQKYGFFLNPPNFLLEKSAQVTKVTGDVGDAGDTNPQTFSKKNGVFFCFLRKNAYLCKITRDL